jgi:hypothetical protein
LNRACELARGKYIARMDADDVAMPERLAWQVTFLEDHPEVGVVGGAFEAITASGSRLLVQRNPSGDQEIKAALLEYCALLHPTVLMRRDVFVSVGGYRKVVVDAEDYDLWLRIAERSRLANLKAVILKYRLHRAQVSVRKCRQEALSGLAARTAAALRRSGKPDPLESLREINPSTLSAIGVSQATQGAAIAMEALRCVRNMYKVGEYSIAVNAVTEILGSSEANDADGWVLAELQILAARLYWQEARFGSGVVSAARAIIARPKILGRPVKRLLSEILCGGRETV